jgi:lysozyme
VNPLLQRTAVAFLSLTFASGVYLVQREGYSDGAIIPTKGDVPTIGFGSTSGVKMGDRTDPVRALMRAASELDTTYEQAVKRCVSVPLFQWEYDALVILTYNIGVAAFCGSQLVKALNRGDYAQAAERILDWKMFRGQDCSKPNKICGGLWKDRLKTYELFKGPK